MTPPEEFGKEIHATPAEIECCTGSKVNIEDIDTVPRAKRFGLPGPWVSYEELDDDVSPKQTLDVKERAMESEDNVGNDNTIIHSIARFLRRFLFLKEEAHYTLIGAWIVGTHLHKHFDYSGYLFAHSPERQSGKTTLLEILNLLVYKSTGLQISPTEAVMFRTAEDHTHLLDEVDSWKNGDDLKDVLNAGYKKGALVTRCEGKGSYKPTTFKVFAPRVLAGIGITSLPSPTLDRTFAIPMVRQKKDEKREPFRERRVGAEAKKLKADIENWVKKNEKAVGELYDRWDAFPYLECFTDRTIDIAEPLAAIVEVAYADHPKGKEARKTLVQAIGSTRKEQQAPSREHRALKCLLELAGDEGPLVGNASELAGLCANSEEPIDDQTITQTLRRYGFKTKSVRKDGANPLYRYSLSKADLQDLVDRYVVETPEG